MLTTLRIEHFTLVKHMELDFAGGMTAFTGETGAGKSIMIDALMLALGGRADATVIRPGEEKCDISAAFQLDLSGEPIDWLKEHDIACEQGELVLRRIINAEGRSKSTINGQPFPLQKVRELSNMLVHIHGQHQHQTLLNHITHLHQLDRFAGHHDLLAEVGRLYKSCQKTQSELDSMNLMDRSSARRNLLQFQLEELQTLAAEEGEMSRLHTEHQMLHHAHDYLHQTQHMLQMLGEEEPFNLCQALNQLLHTLQEMPQEHKSVKNVTELLNNALIQCEESMSELQAFAEQVQIDPERLQELEERMSALHQAARKYQVDANQLPQLTQSLQQELDSLQQIEEKMQTLQQALNLQIGDYQKAAEKLRLSRQQSARLLAQEITQIIQRLGMPKGEMHVEMTPLEGMQVHGMDKVEYKVRTNPGMPMDNLAKIASGGELSRISLAIQMISAERGATPTLLFDEVDVGIGGATAALVGKLLGKLGERLQVFCVTHQAQVASSARHHFLVEKFEDNGHTFSRIIPLAEPDKISEIARMLGGLTITEQTLAHARELLESQGIPTHAQAC